MITVHAVPTFKHKALARPFSFEMLVPLDEDHERRRETYGFDPALGRKYQSQVVVDGRIVARVYIYVPLEIDAPSLSIKVLEHGPE